VPSTTTLNTNAFSKALRLLRGNINSISLKFSNTQLVAAFLEKMFLSEDKQPQVAKIQLDKCSLLSRPFEQMDC
jgi:hypothetical protein